MKTITDKVKLTSTKITGYDMTKLAMGIFTAECVLRLAGIPLGNYTQGAVASALLFLYGSGIRDLDGTFYF